MAFLPVVVTALVGVFVYWESERHQRHAAGDGRPVDYPLAPTTRSGWVAVGALAGAVLLQAVFAGETVGAGAPLGVVALAAGAWALMRRQERGLLAFAATGLGFLIGLFPLLFTFGG